MIILENKFTPVAINIPLADIGIDAKKVLDTTDELGGFDLSPILYLPVKDKDKLLALINDMVQEIAIENGYYNYHYKCSNMEMTIEETNETYPNVFPIAYNVDFDIEYSANDTPHLKVWIEPKNPEDEQYLDDNMVLEFIPIELQNDDMKYLLNVLTEVICNME